MFDCIGLDEKCDGAEVSDTTMSGPDLLPALRPFSDGKYTAIGLRAARDGGKTIQISPYMVSTAEGCFGFQKT